MRRAVVSRSNPPTAVVAPWLQDDVLAVVIPKSNVYVRRANPPFSWTNIRNTGDITQTSSESPPQKLGRDLECEHGTAVVCDRKRAHRLLSVIRKRHALQDCLPAIVSVVVVVETVAERRPMWEGCQNGGQGNDERRIDPSARSIPHAALL